MNERSIPTLVVADTYIDEHLVIVNKPAGEPTHAPSASAPGLVERMQDTLGQTLGVHQRLDALTSGLVVFSRTPEAARALAAQFEGRSVRKHYRAVVAGAGSVEEELIDNLSELEQGRVSVVPSGRRAHTLVHRATWCGPYAICDLEPRTGRTHQLRVQLASRGTPILGDVIYGGGRAGRMMLHAWELELELPGRGTTCLVAPLPTLFDEDALRQGFLLHDVVSVLPRVDPPTAERIADPVTSGLPGVKVDQYGDTVVVRHYPAHAGREEGAASWGWDAASCDALGAALGKRDGVRCVARIVHASHKADDRAAAGAPAALFGAIPAEAFVVREDEVSYEISLHHGMGCGLYLDQRPGRAWVREKAPGREVLNLFAYTCGFSVAAAVGGAWRTTSVDISPKVLDWGRRNMEHNGIDPGTHRFWADDALTVLRRAASRGERYGVVVCDPPSFARRGRKTFSLKRDLSSLIEGCIAAADRHGWVYLSVNHRGIGRQLLAQAAQQAAERAGRRLLDTATELLEDSWGPLGVGTDLKALKLRVE